MQDQRDAFPSGKGKEDAVKQHDPRQLNGCACEETSKRESTSVHNGPPANVKTSLARAEERIDEQVAKRKIRKLARKLGYEITNELELTSVDRSSL